MACAESVASFDVFIYVLSVVAQPPHRHVQRPQLTLDLQASTAMEHLEHCPDAIPNTSLNQNRLKIVAEYEQLRPQVSYIPQEQNCMEHLIKLKAMWWMPPLTSAPEYGLLLHIRL